MSEICEVFFDLIPEPNLFYFDLHVCFDGAPAVVGGSSAVLQPEDDLMRAALMMLVGYQTAYARMTHEPSGAMLSFDAEILNEIPYGERRPADWRPQQGCVIRLIELDGDNNPEGEPLILGVATSVFQLARAALDFGERRQAWRRQPSPPLVALRAVLPVLEESAMCSSHGSDRSAHG